MLDQVAQDRLERLVAVGPDRDPGVARDRTGARRSCTRGSRTSRPSAGCGRGSWAASSESTMCPRTSISSTTPFDREVPPDPCGMAGRSRPCCLAMVVDLPDPRHPAAGLLGRSPRLGETQQRDGLTGRSRPPGLRRLHASDAVALYPPAARLSLRGFDGQITRGRERRLDAAGLRSVEHHPRPVRWIWRAARAAHRGSWHRMALIGNKSEGSHHPSLWPEASSGQARPDTGRTSGIPRVKADYSDSSASWVSDGSWCRIRKRSCAIPYLTGCRNFSKTLMHLIAK